MLDTFKMVILETIDKFQNETLKKEDAIQRITGIDNVLMKQLEKNNNEELTEEIKKLREWCLWATFTNVYIEE